MRRLLCALGWHTKGQWFGESGEGYGYRYCACKHCGIVRWCERTGEAL